MKNISFRKWFVLSALFVFMCFSPHGLLRAQSTANYVFSTSATGSLVDMSTGTSQLIGPGADASASAVTGIGFNFPFMGSTFTQFSANDDGIVQLGGTTVGTNVYTISGGTAASPRIAAFNADLRVGTVNGKVHYKVIGTAPNRQLVVEFKEMMLFYLGTATTGTSTFQVVLSETSGKIDFNYGTMSVGDIAAGNKSPSIGFYVGAAANSFVSVAYSSNTATTTGTYTANPAVAATGPIASLTSVTDGTRRVYSFLPTPPVAPTALNFTAVGGNVMTLNWTDNASNELGYRVYRSTDNVNFTMVSQLPANTITYPATGLSVGTLYYWNVVSYLEVESLPINGSQSTNPGTISGVKTVGSGGDYQNLTTAFADINAQGLVGNVELQMIAGYPAAPETYPIVSCNNAATGTFSVKVYPTVSGLFITSANATGTLNLNGATNLTFDGRVNQTGASDLVISNTNAGASYAVQFVNDARTNTLQYLTIHSANTSATSGTIVFAGSTGTTGNDNNLIDNCDIKDGATTPLNGIYSAGTSTAIDNSGNTVSNSNIYNYFGASTASNGILVSSNSSAWTINANKFYQTATRTLTGGSQHRGINIITSNGNGYVITNNVIGYASSTATGITTYTASAGRFFGIELTASNSGTASTIQGNTVSGISLSTTSGTTGAPGIFAGISVLSGTVNVGNTTPNIIGAGTGNGAISVTTSTSANIFGIHSNSTGTLNVSNNVIGAINGTGATAAVVCGMTAINNTGSSTATTISGNTIGGVTSNSIAIGTLGTSTSAGTFSGISSTGSHTALTVSGNTINNVSNYHNNTSSASNGIISTSGTAVTVVMNNNTVSNMLLAAGALTNLDGGLATTLTANGNTVLNSSVTGVSGTIYGMRASTSQFTFNNNVIHDLAITANSGTGASVVYGIYNLASPTVENITNNQIYNLSIAGATTSTSSIIMGIHTNTTASSVKNFSGNVINGLSFTNSSTGTATMNGISSASGATMSIYKNKIYNLSASGATSIVSGIVMTSGVTGNVYNNIIGDLKTPTASAADAIRGISINSSTTSATYRVYYNSVYLNASSTGTNFGTSGIYHQANGTATTAALDMRNNIIINESTPAGTGISAAFRRSNGSLANFASTSNRNLLYAGTPSATRAIMYDGTTVYQTMSAYQTAVAAREVNSFTGETTFTGTGYGTAGNFFISTTPSNVDYLKPVAGIATQAESGAANISTPAITDDYAAAVRQGNAGYAGTGTAPDLGAFEFEGLPLAPPSVTFNSITPNTQQCTATPRLVSVNVTNTFGSVTGVVINYNVNGVAQTPVTMINTTGTTWEGTIPVPTPGNASITWSVTATNSVALSGSYNGTAYTDEPLTGIPVVANATPNPICAGSSTELRAGLVMVGTASYSASSGTSSSAAVSPFYHGYGGVKTQYIYRASELTAMGFSAGNISALALNITTLGTTTLNGFTINVGHTAQNAAVTNAAITTGLNQVYSNAAQTLVAGTNTFTFSTPFAWDGTSNVVVSFNYSNNNTGGTSSTVATEAALGFTPSLAIYADNAAVACLFNAPASGQACMGTNSNTTTSTRPYIVFTGNKTPAVQTISWSDGVGTVGTTNPLTVTPAATTTYTATITAAGCSVSPSPSVTVTVNPLPGTPTAANSTQCGLHVPTASVTSTSGLPTPTFNWYSAPSAGTLLQSGTSATYTTAISATTTFYVSEINTVTGCEGARVVVTVTVNTPDAISASSSATAICLNNSVNLTAANTNGTPVQNYTYSWSGTTGSGAETPVAGNPATITPTAVGNYTYNVIGVDAGCVTTTTISVTVNGNPVANTAGVSDNVICNGEQVNLTSSLLTTATPLAQDFNSGLGTWTTTFNGTAPVTTGFAIQNPPYTYDGAVDFTNFATPQGGGFAMSNADMGTSGNKTRTTLVSPTFSTAGMTSGTLTFQNLYRKWNSGDSLVRLEISVNGGTSWATLKDYLSLGDQGVITNNAQVPANESITLTAPYLNQPNLRIRFNYISTWGYFWIVDDVKVTGSSGLSLAWTSSPAGFTSSAQNPTGVAPAVSTTYTITATNGAGCTSTASVAVTVNQPSAATVPVTACSTYTWPINGQTYTTSGTHTATIPNAAGCDSVITLNLTINTPTTATVNQSACITYTWPINGQTYTTSGTHTATIMNAAGCDSVITLNLTINQPTTGTDVQSACVSYTWIDGVTYTASNNTATHTIVGGNANGCDSVVTLNLTILQPTTGTDVQSACVSYTWIDGVTYTASNNTATHTIVGGAVNGCDSIVTLNLIINLPTTSSLSETECTSYTWGENGTTYTTSGAYTATLAGAAINGCDSIITLNLTIIQPTTSSVSATACTSYTWSQNGMTYTASGAYNDTIPNAAGCDSIITLNLTINSVTTSTVTISTCNPTYTWAQNGTVYNATGMYNDTITNAAGCDSIVTLNLTIAPFVATATNNGNATITASTGTTYQWINCTTNTAIAGATTQTFTATVNGTYAAVVSNGTCSDTTNCVNITNVGIKENTISTISVHPNPTHDFVIVTMEDASAIVEVMDVQGKLVQTTQIKSGDQIDLGAYERGVYTLRIKTESGTSIERIVKN